MPDDFIGGLRRGEMAADNFTIVANAAVRDKRLSCAEKGLLVNVFSHKEGFVITEEFLASQCTDGVKAIRGMLVRLREVGYVYRSEQRMRYPKGTKNEKGKDISGALGPYQWFVTDKPAEIAIILARYAEEQRAANLAAEEPPLEDHNVSAGQDYMPQEEVVPTCGNVDNVTGEEVKTLPPVAAGSPDLRKHDESAGRDYRPKPPGGLGRSIEDDHEKTRTTENDPGGLPAAPQTPAELNLDHPSYGADDQGKSKGDPLRARAEAEPGARAGDAAASGYVDWDPEDLVTELKRQNSLATEQTGRDLFVTSQRITQIRSALRHQGAQIDATGHVELGQALTLVDVGMSPKGRRLRRRTRR